MESNKPVRFDGTTLSYLPVDNLSRGLRFGLIDKRGNTWYRSFQNGAYCYYPDTDGLNGSLIQFSEDNGLPNNQVSVILEDRKGNLWFGTNGGGVTYYISKKDGKEGNFIHYTTNEGLIHNRVNTIFEDYQGNIWLGTDGGLSLFDGKRFISYGEELGSNMVWTINEDNQQNIWLSTKKSVNFFHKDSLSSVLDSGFRSHHFRSFGQLDGLQKADFDFISFCQDSKNQIWWGGGHGYTKLDPDQFEIPTKPIENLRLTHIEINQQFIDFRKLSEVSYNSSLPFGEDLSQAFDSVVGFYNYPQTMDLPYDLNHLTFYFSAIDWAGPHKIKYQYFMEGF